MYLSPDVYKQSKQVAFIERVTIAHNPTLDQYKSKLYKNCMKTKLHE